MVYIKRIAYSQSDRELFKGLAQQNSKIAKRLFCWLGCKCQRKNESPFGPIIPDENIFYLSFKYSLFLLQKKIPITWITSVLSSGVISSVFVSHSLSLSWLFIRDYWHHRIIEPKIHSFLLIKKKKRKKKKRLMWSVHAQGTKAPPSNIG